MAVIGNCLPVVSLRIYLGPGATLPGVLLLLPRVIPNFKRVLPLWSKKQRAASGEGSEKLFQKLVLEAVLKLIHATKENALTVGAIARETNKLLERMGEILSLQPRAVGSILRSLRIPTEGLGAQGRGITLLKSVRTRIHFLAMDRGVNLELTNPGDCQICFEADPANGMYEDLSKMTPEELDEYV